MKKMIKENKIVLEALGFLLVLVIIWVGYMQFVYYPSFEKNVKFSQVNENIVSHETIENISLKVKSETSKKSNQKIRYSIQYDETINGTEKTENYYYNYDYNVYEKDSIVNIALKAYIIEIDGLEYTLLTDLSGSYYLNVGNDENFENGQNVIAYTTKESNFNIIGFYENADFSFTNEKEFQNEGLINREINTIIELETENIYTNL